MTHASDLDLRILDLQGDKEKSLHLMRTAYGENSEVANAIFYDWQYLENPAGRALVAGYFTKDDKIVSQVASIPAVLVVDGKREVYYMTLNIATDPNYRNRHLVSHLFSFLHKQFKNQFTFGMPNANSLSLHKRIGYKVLEIPILYKVIRPSKLLNSGFAGSLIDKVIFRPKKEVMDSIELHKSFLDYRDNYLSEKPKSRIFRERSAEYLYWRFNSIPTREYTILRHKSDDASYLIGREIPEKKASVICELQAKKEQTAQDLIDAFSAHSYETKQASIIMTGYFENNSPYAYLRSAGFRKLPTRLRPHPLALCVMQLLTYADPIKPNSWFFSLGDFDIF